MKTIKHIILALLSVFTLSAYATAFTSETTGQVKITSNSSNINYVEYYNDATNNVTSVNFSTSLSDGGNRFTETYTSNSGKLSVDTKNKTTKQRLYYSTFFTKVTVPAKSTATVSYKFDGTITKTITNGGLIYEFFDYGDISASDAETIHKNITFNYNSNNTSSSNYSVKRTYSTNQTNTISTTITKTYDNSSSDSPKEITNYWGVVFASRYVNNNHTFTAEFTPTFEMVTYDEKGYGQNGELQEPELKDGYYLIKNEANLYWFAQQVNSGNNSINAKLENDIIIDNNVLDESLNPVAGNYKPWTPIGTSTRPFKGQFLGQKHTISGIVVASSTAQDYAGLFGYADGCTIQDIRLVNSFIRGNNYVGGIVGRVKTSSQKQAYVKNCLSEAYVEGQSYVGGIAGSLEGYDYSQYYGLSHTYYNVNMLNCICIGNVDGQNNYVGGDAGYLDITNVDNITFSGMLITIKDLDTDVSSQYYYGCNWGISTPNNTINNFSFSYTNLSAFGVYQTSQSGTATALGNAYGYDQDGTIFFSSPQGNEGEEIIDIINERAASQGYEVWNLTDDGSGDMYIFKKGKETHPYEITCVEDLEKIAQNVINGNPYKGGHFVLLNDIDEALTIAIGTSDTPFAGNFEGNGYQIKLALNDANATGNGLFAHTKNATIKNVVVTGSVSGNTYVGGIVGNADNTQIINCSNIADISATLNAGGIVGIAKSTDIVNCSNAGKIKQTGTDTFEGGAIVGRIQNNSIENCFWYENSASAAVGTNVNNTASITNVKSFKFNNGKLVINNPSGSSDLLSVLSSFAQTNGMKTWTTFLGEESGKMFVLDYWPVKISQYLWSSVCLPFNTKITSGNGKAYYVVSCDDKILTEKLEANVIPAGEGVIIKGEAGAEVIFKITDEDADEVTANELIGTLNEGGETFGPESGYKFYMLTASNNVFGFYWDKKTLDEGNSCTCQQYKAILKVDQTTANTKSFFSLDDFETGDDRFTGIDLAETSEKANAKIMHNLSGQVVGEGYKGIVIINGKKYLK